MKPTKQKTDDKTGREGRISNVQLTLKLIKALGITGAIKKVVIEAEIMGGPAKVYIVRHLKDEDIEQIAVELKDPTTFLVEEVDALEVDAAGRVHARRTGVR